MTNADVKNRQGDFGFKFDRANGLPALMADLAGPEKNLIN
jgi:hypothetical protein